MRHTTSHLKVLTFMNINSVAKNCSTSKSCCAWRLAAALLLLRVCVGWHFFAEGLEKISVDEHSGEMNVVFSAEGFFRIATGPLADTFHSFVPGEHDWQHSLAVPNELTPESLQKLESWVGSYVKRRQTELAKRAPTEVEVPEFLPYAAWYENIDANRRQLLTSFTRVKGLSEEQAEQAATVYESRARQLADYLAGESLDIQTYQHELWRLKNMEAVPGAADIPFRSSRIAEKDADTSREPRKWVAAVKQFDDEFKDELLSVLTEEQLADDTGERAHDSLVSYEEKRLHWMNVAVTCLTIGVGLCLLTGLFTRLASIAGAAFLLSVMATQPPWVPSAYTEYFYYQLVEFAALLFLAASGAGRVAGLDFILHGLWSKKRGAPSTQT